jgi:hypothetical protein
VVVVVVGAALPQAASSMLTSNSPVSMSREKCARRYVCICVYSIQIRFQIIIV